MPSIDTRNSYAPNRLLSALAGEFQARNDDELAEHLRISPEVLRSIRSGRISVSPSLLLLMAESAGKDIGDLHTLLGDRRRKARMPCYIAAPVRQRTG